MCKPWVKLVAAGVLLCGCMAEPARPPVAPTPAQETSPERKVRAAPNAELPKAREAPPENSVPTPEGNASPRNLAARSNGVDWPSFLGPTGDSKSPETGIITEWPKTGLKIVWQRPLRESYGIGSVSRGRYFQLDREGAQVKLFALHAETGEPLWEFSYPTTYSDYYGYNGGPRCSPVIDEDRVYVYGAEGLLHCLSAESGEVVWKVDTVEKFGVVQNFFGVGSTPVIEGDLLIAVVGGSPPESQNLGPGRSTACKATARESLLSTSGTATSNIRLPTNWPVTPRRNSPPSTAAGGASSSLATAWSASNRRPGKSTFDIRGGPRSWKA